MKFEQSLSPPWIIDLWRESDDFETILFPLSGSPIFPLPPSGSHAESSHNQERKKQNLNNPFLFANKPDYCVPFIESLKRRKMGSNNP